MKKHVQLLITALALYCAAAAQHLDSSKIKKGLPLPDLNGKKISIITDIRLFDRPGYGGNSGYFKVVDGKIVAPFPLTNISFTVPLGKIVYIKKCDTEFPYEEAYTASQTNISLANVCGVRSDNATGFTVQFNGISTSIHNNDCKKVFGDIQIKVIERAPGDNAQSYMTCSAGTSFRGTDAFTFQAFKNASAATTPPYSNYVHNSSPSVPNVSTIVRGNGTVGEALGSFRVGASALREGRVMVVVTSNIASAHKTCDLCDDFTSNVHMTAPVTESFPLNKTYSGSKIVNAAHNKVVLGPYHAHGSRDGVAITASAGTEKDFRVHLTVTGL